MQKRLSLFLTVSFLGGLLVLGACNTDNPEKEVSSKSNPYETKEENIEKPEIHKEKEEVEKPEKEDVVSNISISEWQDVPESDAGYGLHTYRRVINDTEPCDSIIIYTNGEFNDIIALDDGKGMLYEMGEYPGKLRGGVSDFTAVAKYKLNNQENNIDISIKNFNSDKNEFLDVYDYTVDGTFESSVTSPFIVAYKIYSETSDYFTCRVSSVVDGEGRFYESVYRTNNDEKFNIEILGCVSYEPFDNNNIIYDKTNFDISYDVRSTETKAEQSYRQYNGTTPFLMTDNTFSGLMYVKANSTSEIGSIIEERFSIAVSGKGVIKTFLEIPGDQSEDPVYKFITDEVIPFETIK